MRKIICYSLIATICGIFISSAPSYALYETKDAFYFMKDDNEFSPEEMDEEAMYIHSLCEGSSIQSTYFDCSCIAGAYRQEREKSGPYVPQSHLINDLYDKNERGCANTEKIAGQTYSYCQGYAKSFRYRESDNEEYCSCVANKVAKSFQKKPQLSMDYISDLRVNALTSCD